ncbi:MAG: hypothetical protein NVSMB64_06050 [Candidatus Velthaea sp.]
MIRRLVYLCAILAAFVVALTPGAALARAHDHGETRFFTNVTVEPDEVIDGNLNVIFGDATVKGHVTGDVNVIGGTCTAYDGALIDGEQHCFLNDAARDVAPWLASSTGGIGAFAEQDRKLFVKLASSAIVVLVFLLFPLRMRLALDRVERHPGLAAAVGVGAFIAIVPIAILLLLSIIGIPLIVLEAAAIFAGVWLGTGAIALLVGRRLFELVMPRTTPSPLAALVLGLVVVSAAQIVPFVGWAVTALVWLVGLGAAIMAFINTSGGTPFGGPGTFERSPIGGPPMKQSA